MNTTKQIVSRGFVVVYRDNIRSTTRTTAVVSGPEAARLQKRVGGRIVNVKGMAFRYVQNRSLRVLVNPAEAATA